MISSDLKEKVLEFADSRITASQLEEWLVPRLPFFLRSPDSADADVVAAIELGLAEISAKIRTEAELRDDLMSVVRTHSEAAPFYRATMSTDTESGSANQTLHAAYQSAGSWTIVPVM